jgi:hypothetical protein
MSTIIKAIPAEPKTSALESSPLWKPQGEHHVDIDELSSVHKRLLLEMATDKIQSIHRTSGGPRHIYRLGQENMITRSREEVEALEDLEFWHLCSREQVTRHEPAKVTEDVFHTITLKGRQMVTLLKAEGKTDGQA